MKLIENDKISYGSTNSCHGKCFLCVMLRVFLSSCNRPNNIVNHRVCVLLLWFSRKIKIQTDRSEKEL